MLSAAGDVEDGRNMQVGQIVMDSERTTILGDGSDGEWQP